MTQVVLAAIAADDFLTIIANLIVAAGLETAASYDAKLERALARLARYPESGSPRPKLGRGVRVVMMSPYVVFYTFDSGQDVVSIVRIRHQRRLTRPKDVRGH